MPPKTKRQRQLLEALSHKKPKISSRNEVSESEQPENDISVCKTPTRLPKKPLGRRIISLTSLEIALNEASEHGKNCKDASLTIISEKRDGLSTQLNILCSGCHQKLKVTNDSGDCTLPCNEGGIWAANASGTGFSPLKHSLAILEIPFMSQTKFLEREREFHDRIQNVADRILEENGREERNLAVELGWIDSDGVPFTEVEGDGAWGKRSYGNKGTSLAGSAVLIGTLTRKPLFISTRIKSCYTCKVYGKDHPHKCFKNYNESTNSMEPSMILEGFQRSFNMHNMRYKRFIGDGDSSTYNEIQAVYCSAEHNFTVVEKIECKNHLIRRMNKNLRKLMGQKIYCVDDRKLFGEIVHNIGKACIYATAYHADNRPKTNHLALRTDIENILDHCIGNHSKCHEYFCVNGKLIIPTKYKTVTVIQETEEADGSPDQKQSSNQPSKSKFLRLQHTLLYQDCKKIISRLAQNSVSLLVGRTTNLSEGYFSQFSKFLQGKRTNTVLAGSYHRKSLLTLFASLYGTGWYSPIIEMKTGKIPAAIIQNQYKLGLKKRAQQLKNKKLRKRVSKREIFPNKKATPKFFSRSTIYTDDDKYGLNHPEPDMPDELLKKEIEIHWAKNSISTFSDQWDIHLQTLNQFENPIYIEKRSTLITASIAGKLFKLKDKTCNVTWLDRIINDYPKFKGNQDTNWGKINEPKAIKKYESVSNSFVNKAGLFISLENPKLAASPDGLVGKDGLVEIKCPAREKYCLPEDVFNRKTGSYLSKSKEGILILKRNHDYFFQVVMQLNITNRSWCDFAIWTQGPLDENGSTLFPDGLMIIDRIFRDETLPLWQSMKEKFYRFSMEDLIPEIVDSRRDRNMEFRQPPYRMEKILEAEARKLKSEMERALLEEEISAVMERVISSRK